MLNIVIIGKKNVGKSSLFNLLTQNKTSTVIDYKGYTRDRNTQITKLNSNIHKITDTAGIGYNTSEIESLSFKQTWVAIKESNLIIFVLEILSDLNYTDINIINTIKKLKKKIIYVINKIDKININKYYHNLNYNIKDPILISVKEKIGLELLYNKIKNHTDTNKINTNLNEKDQFKLIVLGKPNVGKSSLINKIIHDDRVIVHNSPGTTRDNIYINHTIGKKKIVLIDTAGIKKKKNIKNEIEKISTKKSLDSIKSCNISILVLDIKSKITKQDLILIRYIIHIGKPIIIAINKSDLLNKETLKLTEKKILSKLKFSEFIKYYFISSKYGFGIKYLLKNIVQIYSFQKKRITTNILKTIVKNISEIFINKKKYIKIHYASIIKYEPLIIYIYIYKLNLISINYKRYIIKIFINEIKITNIPIKIKFKNVKF